MKESGQLQRIFNKCGIRQEFQQHCLSSEDGQGLAMKDVFVVFIMLLAAMVIALALLNLEKLCVKYYG